MSLHDQVLSDFIDAWNAGRRPRVREYLGRVDDERAREALADAIADWLELAPAPALDDAARADVRRQPAVDAVLGGVEAGAGLWPELLPRLRERGGLSVGDLAARLAERFSLGAPQRERAAGYLDRLERGELEPARVSRRLLDALGDLLGLSGASLADAGGFGVRLRPPAAAGGGTLLRADGPAGDAIVRDLEVLSRAATTPAPAPMDEVDRLFTGGPEG